MTQHERFHICLLLGLVLLGFVPIFSFSILSAAASPRVTSTNALALSSTALNYQIPFDGMSLVYFSETEPILQQEMGLAGSGLINLTFHDLTPTSSTMDILVNGTATESGRQIPVNVNTAVEFPTNQDTLLFLRNGGQQNLQIFAGAAGQAIQIIPGYSFQLTRSWDLHDQTLVKTSLGSFSVYRYHTSISVGGTALDFYASYEKSTQVLVYGEVYATQGAGSALIEKIELQQTNVQFTNTTGQSPQCVIATAAYGSELAAPVQFLRNFRDNDVNQTNLGHNFLSAFNAWYYSWAPSIARIEAGNSELRAGVRAAIIPLLGTLFLSSTIFNLGRSLNPEAAILIAGLAASTILGLVYLTPIAFITQRALKRRITARTILSVSILGLVLAMIATLTHGSVSIVENLTAIIVVETILLAPTLLVRSVTHELKNAR